MAAPGIASLLAAQFVSALADNALLLLAMALLAEQGYPVFWIPLLKLMFTLSYVVLGPWVGAWADTWPKRRVMMWANGIKAMACMGMVVGVPPMLAFGLAGLGAAIYAPAKYGLITELTPAEQLVRANGWIEVSTVCAALFGVMLGGLLVADRLQGWSFYADLNLWLGSGSRFNASLAAVLLLYGLAAWLNRLIPDSGVRYPSHAWHVLAVWQRFKQDHLKLWRDPLGSISSVGHHLVLGRGCHLAIAGLGLGTSGLALELGASGVLARRYRFGCDCRCGIGSTHGVIATSAKGLDGGHVVGCTLAPDGLGAKH
jgi:MFS transporter, LPLT family, lysophospholipid transporter